MLGLQASRNAFIGLAMAAALLLCVPWMAHRFSGIRSIVEATSSQQPAQAYVFGGRRISGFLVIGNDQPLYVDTPSLHLADFEAIIAQSGVEGYQELIDPILPRVPFGFIFAPRIERESSSSFQYIVPAKVLEWRDVTAWRFYWSGGARKIVSAAIAGSMSQARNPGGPLAMSRPSNERAPHFART